MTASISTPRAASPATDFTISWAILPEEQLKKQSNISMLNIEDVISRMSPAARDQLLSKFNNTPTSENNTTNSNPEKEDSDNEENEESDDETKNK